MNPNLQKIQENMYNLYKMTPQELDRLLGQTYHRKRVGESGILYSETYACVVKLLPQDSQGFMYGELYNELALTWNKACSEDREDWLCLTVYSIDDGWWRGHIPITEQPLSLLWSSILEMLKPDGSNFDWDNWERFRHSYFLKITKELGATEYDYD